MTMVATSGPGRLTQAARRARTRSALLEAAARGLSRDGYANLVLERVAREAGYTRGALYHLFANKEDLALAVVGWVEETWFAEVGHLLADDTDPVGALSRASGVGSSPTAPGSSARVAGAEQSRQGRGLGCWQPPFSARWSGS